MAEKCSRLRSTNPHFSWAKLTAWWTVIGEADTGDLPMLEGVCFNQVFLFEAVFQPRDRPPLRALTVF